MEQSLFEDGWAPLGQMLQREECAFLRGLYADPARFRSRIVMERYRFGRGEDQYLRYSLPEAVQQRREALYAQLAPIATRLQQALGQADEFPSELGEFLEQCHARGQSRPTPLLLRYQAGGFNCLHHQYTGGELLLLEQRPRAQSKGQVILGQGEAVANTTRYRPARGKRGNCKANVRHGVSSPVREGERFTSGVIFHDAE
ncbi:MAG: 2OG-Fe(II) oxygenase [Bryobacteraceae bacterium]